MDIIGYIYLLIELELNVGDLYKIFADNNNEDYIFWMQLYNEENNHASLLGTCVDFVYNDIDVSIILSDNINNLLQLNKKINEIKEGYIKTKGRELSFQIAMNIENIASESHYQNIMTDENNDNRIIDIIKRLNKDDIDHFNRIKKYYNSIYDKEI